MCIIGVKRLITLINCTIRVRANERERERERKGDISFAKSREAAVLVDVVTGVTEGFGVSRCRVIRIVG